MTDLLERGNNSSNSFDEEYVDEVVRKNEIAFRYTTIFHSSLCEKLYQELCALAFGEYDIPGGQISPVMWTKLYEIFSEVENQTRKLPTGANYSISSQKFANEAVQIASVLSIFTALAHEYEGTQEVSLLSKLVVTDVEFRRIYALLQWSEKAISEQQFEQGLGDKVRKLETTKSVRMNSIMALKRPTFGANPPKDASLDPDAHGTKEDRVLEQMALHTLFQLVRSGETAKAANLAVDLGMAAIGAQLQLHSMLRNPLDVPLESTKQNFGEYKRVNRAKYYQMTQKLIDQSNGDENDPYWMIVSAIRGNVAPMLKTGKTVVEKVWAYANSAFLARILAAEGVLSTEQITELFDVPLTAKSIIDELRTQSDNTGEVLILLRVIDDMLNDDIEDLYKFAKETVGEYIPKDPTCEVNMLGLDVFFHLVAVAYASGFEPNDDGNAVIALGFDDLRARKGTVSHKRMAAFYSRFLPEDMKLFQIVETMKLVDSEQERAIFAESLKQSDIDFAQCVCTLIQQIRREDESRMIDLDTQIDHWNWLLVGKEQTALAALEECNRLIRKVMLKDPVDEPLIRKIIRTALKSQLPKNLSVAVVEGIDMMSLIEDGNSSQLTEKIEHAALEFAGLCSVIDVNNFMITIALKLGLKFKYTPITEEEMSEIGGVKRMDTATPTDWEASLRVRARAEQTLQEDILKRKTVDHNARIGLVQQHLDTALPMLRGLVTNIGLRTEYFLSPRQSGDPSRSHRQQIRDIRNKFLPQFFVLLAEAAAKLNDMTNFHEFFASFEDDLDVDSKWLSFVKKFYAQVNLKVE